MEIRDLETLGPLVASSLRSGATAQGPRVSKSRISMDSPYNLYNYNYYCIFFSSFEGAIHVLALHHIHLYHAMMREGSKAPPQGTILVYPRQPPYTLGYMVAMATLLFYSEAVAASRRNWLRCTGYHGKLGVLVIAV